MQRHDRLGEVLLDISVDPAPPVAEIEQRLREEAAKMGANAVFVVRDAVRPGDARKLIGIAIRYRNESPVLLGTCTAERRSAARHSPRPTSPGRARPRPPTAR